MTGLHSASAASVGQDEVFVFPASFAQQRLWFLEQFEPGTPFYTIPAAVRLCGRLDPAVLERALNEIVRRHEVLRTTFAESGGQTVQLIAPSLSLEMVRRTLSGLPADRREAAAFEELERAARIGFDLSAGPLLRALLLTLDEQDHLLLLTLHHIIADGWSIGVLMGELTAIYDAFYRGRPSPLPEPPIQYADFAEWQREYLTGAVLQRQLDYWTHRLGGELPVLNLPNDRPRSPVQTSSGALVSVRVAAERIEPLKALCRQEGATLFMGLLAVFEVLLFRYTGQHDFAVGSPVANRGRAEIEPLIGLFVNTLVLRADLSGRPTFRELLHRVRNASLEAYAHQDLPFEMLVDALQVERDASRSPLFQVMFILQNEPIGPSSRAPTGEAAALSIEPLEIDTGTATFDLTLAAAEAPDGLHLTAEFNTDLFDRTTIERLLQHYLNLLSAGATPDQAVASQELLDESERHRIIVDWNATGQRVEKGDSTLSELFEAAVAAHPEAPAVIRLGLENPGEAVSLSYRELDSRANQLAHYLRAIGVAPDDRVGLALDRSIEMAVGLLGILKAGAAYLPLDPAYPADLTAFMVRDSGARIVLTRSALQASLPEFTTIQILALDSDWPAIARHPTERPAVVTTLDHLAYVLYTSGSTGQPKGVMVSHASVVNHNRAVAALFGLTESDRLLQFATLNFDSAVEEIFPTWSVGATLILRPPGPAPSSFELSQWVEAYRISVLDLPTSYWHAWVDELDLNDQAPTGMLRLVIVGGETASPSRLASWQDRTAGRGVRWLNSYGPTETTVIASVFEPRPDETYRNSVPIGRPIPNVRLYVLDGTLQPVPIGVTGELYIGGAGLARGYLGRPDLTAERFVPDPFDRQGGGRLYRSGDLARVTPDGIFEHIGRIDQQLKVRGFRIEPGEVEGWLLQHPAIREAVVDAAEDPTGKRALVAYLMSDSGQPPDHSTLRAFLGDRIPEYSIPNAFVYSPSLPRLPNGKLDRARLPAIESGVNRGESLNAPQTPVEIAMARIWSDVLGVEPIGVDDNFFALGGDSIASLQVVSRARRAKLCVTPRQMFQHQTLGELAAVARSVAEPTSGTETAEGEVPLTPIQHWFFEQHFVNPNHWNQSLLLACPRALDPERLQMGLRAVIRHHDAFRLRFLPGEEGWRQSYSEADTAVELHRESLIDVAEEPLGDALKARCEAWQRRLDLAAGPLLQAVWFDVGRGNRNRLLLVVHHLIVDGVSWRILLEDLEEACRLLDSGAVPALPPPTASLKTWSQALQDHAGSDALAAEARYWLETVPARSPPLPADRPDGSASECHTAVIQVSLSESETLALIQQAASAYRTRVDELLLAALLRTVCDWTGERELLVQMEGHGREELTPGLDLSRTVGWFTSEFPLLLTLPGDDDSAAALIKHVKEQIRHVPNKGIGYGMLRYLQPDSETARSLAERAQPRIAFNYLGRFEGGGPDEALFVEANEAAGAEHDPDSSRSHEFEVNPLISEGRLNIPWTYSIDRYDSETIRGLADAYLSTVRGLVDHCLSPDAGGVTPGDFPLARLDQPTLDALIDDPRSVEDLYPLTPLQQGMLFHTLYDPEAGVYVEQLSCVLDGDLNRAAFLEAWQQVVARHTALRSAFISEGLEAPLQKVLRSVCLPLSEQDWRAMSPAEQAVRWQSLVEADCRRGFDPSEAPLMRLTLARCSDQRWFFLWSHHHLLLDGWCTPLVLQQVFEAYEALRQGLAVERKPSRPFRDYVAWLQSRDTAAAERFWRAQIDGIEAPTPLGLSSPPAGEAEGSGRCFIALNSGVLAALDAFVRDHRITMNTLVQGAWALILSRYSGLSEVVFGVTVAGRPGELAGVESMVGLFINTLPLRITVPPQRPVGEWLGGILQQNSELRQFEYASLTAIQGWSDVPHGQPLFESLLVFENYPLNQALDEIETGIRIRDVRFADLTNYPVCLDVIVDDRLHLNCTYARDRFAASAVERMLGHFSVLLQAIVARPEACLSELPMLTVEEHAGWWDASRSQQSPTRPECCVHQLFEAQADRQPDAVAVVDAAGSTLTYAELERRSNRLARRLRALSVEPDDVVGLALERSCNMTVGLLGILKAGAAYLPLDPAYPPERTAFMIADSAVRIVLTERSVRERFDGVAGVSLLCLDDLEPADADRPTHRPDTRVCRANLAAVIYTSGSTGEPKGVMVNHAAVVNHNLAVAAAFGLTACDRVLQFSTINFDAAVEEIFPTWAVGGTLVLRAPGPAPGARELHRLVDTHSLTVLDLPTAYWHAWVAETALLDDTLPATLRLVVVGGEAAQPANRALWQRRFGNRVRWLNTYGPTETTVIASLFEPGRDEACATTVPIGRPIANLRLYVLDVHLQPAPVGIPGELYIGGAGLARGYRGRAGLTAERFVPDPFEGKGQRLYRTGDLVRCRADGAIEYVGRIDQQLKIRGFRVEPGEIEARLVAHPSVCEAVVAPRLTASGEDRLVAYLVAAPQQQPGAAELRAFLLQTLPEYMVPSTFVFLATLPTTRSGKIDRRALPAPESHVSAGPGSTLPGTLGEQLLADIWREVLGIAAVGIHDNFFALGGHSLLATQVMSRLNRIYRSDLPIRLLFEHPTLADLAGRLEVLARGEAPAFGPIARAPASRARSLSFAQERWWFLDQFEPGNPAYNITSAWRITGRFELGACRNALRAIVERHEVLRSRFPVVDGQVRLAITPVVDPNFPLIDFTAAPEVERPLLVQHHAAEMANHAFDLASGPLFRIEVLRLREDRDDCAPEHVVVMVMHHIVADGWSEGILLREFAELYGATCGGWTPVLGALPIQYADYAAWQRLPVTQTLLERQKVYWLNKLAGLSGTLDLPTDRPRPAIQSYRGATLTSTLEPDLANVIGQSARIHGVTLFMMLLAAFNVLLTRYSGQRDLCIGTPIAGRNRVETEGLIGCFVNTLVLRTSLTGNPRFLDYLDQVRATCLEAQAHQDLPFEALVDALQLQRDPSRNPVFQVMFSLQNTPSEEIRLAGLTLAPLGLPSDTAHFDLTLDVIEKEDGLEAAFEYNADLFEEDTIARFAAHYRKLLESLVERPAARLSELRMLAEGEWNAELGQRHRQRFDVPKRSVCASFELQAAAHGNRIAISDGKREISYGALNRRANRLARYLRDRGLGAESRVAIALESGIESIVAVLAVVKAGAAYLPLDPGLPPARWAGIVAEARPVLILSTQTLSPRISTANSPCLVIDEEFAAGLDYPDGDLGVESESEQLIYVLYTSGSTGQPKGVAVTHGGLANRVHWGITYFGWTGEDAILQRTSLGFDVSAWEIWGALASGARLVIPGSDAGRDAAAMLAQIQGQGVTWIEVVPSLLQALVTVPALVDCKRLRGIGCGAETLAPELSARCRALSGAALYNLYGPTETSVDASVWRCSDADQGLVPIGRPVGNATIFVLDVFLNLVPPGVAGEICIGGAGLARGYLGRPDFTAERFVPNPFDGGGGRLYRTGDLGRSRVDGTIEFLGRIDHQIKIRGYRVEPGEIEACLVSHPGVHQAVVTPQAAATGVDRLVAYVVAERVEPAELREHLRESLPEYMLPAAFVFLEALPQTPSGKVDRSRLPAASPVAAESHVAPSGVLEEAMAALWCELLDVERVGVHDNFFDLGGHSLLAARLIRGIQASFCVDLPLVTLFQAPTIAELAALLSGGAKDADGPLVPLRPSGTGAPLFCFDPTGWHLPAYRPLAESSLLTSPVYGVATRPLLLDEPRRFASLEEAAECYTDRLIADFPQDAYHLLGWSFGSLLAMAVAGVLEARGLRVAFLGLLDADFAWKTAIPVDLLERLVVYLDAADQRRFKAMSTPVHDRLREELSSMDADSRWGYVVAWAMAEGLIEHGRSVELVRLQVQLEERRSRLCESYRQPTLDVRPSIWTATQTLADDAEDRHDWTCFSRLPPWRSTVVGDHGSLLGDPVVHAQIAERVRLARFGDAAAEIS